MTPLALALFAASAIRAAGPVGLPPTEAFLVDAATHSVAVESFIPALRRVGDIHALDRIRTWSVEEADVELSDSERVLGLSIGGEHRAYPIRILNHHEVVNDAVGATPVAVTYCPLCLSGIAFDRRVSSSTRTFDVSGLLYNSGLVLFDRETRSLWPQLLGRAVVGPMTGTRLKRLPLRWAKWKAWKRAHPEGRVLAYASGGDRNYRRVPYKRYHASREPLFPVSRRDDRLPAKQVVFGVVVDGRAKAYPLARLDDRTLFDRVGGVAIEVTGGGDGPAAWRTDGGSAVEGIVAYWFAWAALRPETEVYRD